MQHPGSAGELKCRIVVSDRRTHRLSEFIYKMHYWCPKTSIYVPITHVIFQQTNNQVQKLCFKAIIKLNDELEKGFHV
jgi:hypothetical protein